MFVPMTIHEASRRLRFQLFHIYDEREAENITALVMENITGWQRIDRLLHKSVPLTLPQQQQLEAYTKALLNHAPLQYVLQEAWFYGMRLYVDERVLIPRPETEELADWLIKSVASEASLAGMTGATQVLDIGTGSGCIALAIQKSLPDCIVTACDLSDAALAVAKKNALELQLPVQFMKLDILSETARAALPVFHFIISNPPYIPQKNKAGMAAGVLQYEPHQALFVDDNDPLVFYRALADFAIDHLHKKGCLYLEIHEDLAAFVIELYRQKGFTDIELRKDMQGKERMIKVRS